MVWVVGIASVSYALSFAAVLAIALMQIYRKVRIFEKGACVNDFRVPKSIRNVTYCRGALDLEGGGQEEMDIDWEYPASRAAGISVLDDDTENFTLLMREQF